MIDLSNTQILTNENLLKDRLGVSDNNIPQESSGGFFQSDAYNLLRAGKNEWVASFKRGLNYIKESRDLDRYALQLNDIPIDERTDEENRILYEAIQRERKRNNNPVLSIYGVRAMESTIDYISNIPDMAKSMDWHYPEESILTMIERDDLSIIEKVDKTFSTINEIVKQNFGKNLSVDNWMDVTGEISYEGWEQVKRSFNEPDLGYDTRVTGIVAGGTTALLSGFLSLFDERVTGPSVAMTAYISDIWRGGIINPVIRESSLALGFSPEAAENMGIISEFVSLGEVIRREAEGLSPAEAAKASIESIRTEIQELYGLAPEVRDEYLRARKDQYGLYHYVGVEKFDAAIEEAKVSGDVARLQEIRTEIGEFNKAQREITMGNIRNSVGILVDTAADKMGVRLGFIENGVEVPFLDLSHISFGRGGNIYLQDTKIRQGVQDLSQFWSERGLGKFTKDEVLASVQEYFKDTRLSENQKRGFANQLRKELVIEQDRIKQSVESLYDISEAKREARALYDAAKIDRDNGVISQAEFSKIKKEYAKNLDTVDSPRKLEEIKYQEAIGNIVESGVDGELTVYSWTSKGLEFLPNKKRLAAKGYHMPTALKEKYEADAENNHYRAIIDRKRNDIDSILLESARAEKPISPLERSFRKSGIGWEQYKREQIDRMLANKKKLGELERQIDASELVKRFSVEVDGQGGTAEWMGGGSSFPKWLPSNLRNKKDMLTVWNKLLKGELDIPDRFKNQQDIMQAYLQQLGSNLQYMYADEFRKISEDPKVEANRELRGKLRQTKQVAGAIYNEYNKLTTEVKNTKESLAKARENTRKTRETWKQKYFTKAASNKNRRESVRAIQEAYQLTDADFKKVIGGKDYFQFKTDFEFKQWVYKAEERAYQILERKFELHALQAKIQQKELSNVKNLIRAMDLPGSYDKMTIEQIQQLDKIIDSFESGDRFLTSGLMKAFSKNQQSVYTTRQAKEVMAQELGKHYDVNLIDFEKSIYAAKVRSLREEIAVAEGEVRIELEKELKEIESIQAEIEIMNAVGDGSFIPKSQKTTDQIIKEDKPIKGHWSDYFMPDFQLKQKDYLLSYMVGTFNEGWISKKPERNRIRDRLGELLLASRRSHAGEKNLKQKVVDFLVPTDDLVFDFLNSDANKKVELLKKMTREDLELANFISEIMLEIKTTLQAKDMLENTRENYIANIQKDVFEVMKTKGVKSIIKNIFTKQEGVLDFGAIGNFDEVLSYNKFYRFGLERKGNINPSKDLGKVVMTVVSTYHKKMILDEIIPKVALYKNMLADSQADKFIVQWLNNKKGIKMMSFIQGTPIEKMAMGLKNFTSFLDLAFNPLTVVANTGGANFSNYQLLGLTGMARGVRRKNTEKGKEILKKYESQFGENVLWNIQNEILNIPDQRPLEKFVSLGFSALSQVTQSAINTGFLARLTETEFNTGEISNARIAEIFQEVARTHVVKGNESIFGSTVFGKVLMLYKTWAPPLFLTAYKTAKDIHIDIENNGRRGAGKRNKENIAILLRSSIFPIGVLFAMQKLLDEEQELYDPKYSFHVRRMLQEYASLIDAINPKTWLSHHRMSKLSLNIIEVIESMIKLEEYKITKEGQYDEGDLMFINKFKKVFTPGAIKAMRVFFEDPDGEKKSSGGELDFGELDFSKLDFGDLDFGGLDFSELDFGELDKIQW